MPLAGVGSARLRHPDTAAWIEGWLPDEAYGGRKGVGALSALIPILEDAANGRFLGTFDYSLAFDYTNPAAVIAVFAWLGMPRGTALVLSAVWTAQRRVLQYAGEANPRVQPVGASLPQGDPWSMLAMTVLMKTEPCLWTSMILTTLSMVNFLSKMIKQKEKKSGVMMKHHPELREGSSPSSIRRSLIIKNMSEAGASPYGTFA